VLLLITIIKIDKFTVPQVRKNCKGQDNSGLELKINSYDDI